MPASAQVAPVESVPADPAIGSAEPDEFANYFRLLLQREVEAYGSSSLGRIASQRLEDFSISALLLLTIYPVILAMFLFGVWLSRAGILHDPPGHRRWLTRAAMVGLTLGLPLNGMHVWISELARQPGNEWVWLLGIPVGLAAGPILALGYVSVFALLFSATPGRNVLELLAPAGRMALSNYLLQSIFCTTLCYGYGFGFFGQIGPLAGIGVALVLFAAQVALSHAWLRRFRFGPAEWLWRSLTYRRAQPLLRA
jgi:uncharacterized protein